MVFTRRIFQRLGALLLLLTICSPAVGQTINQSGSNVTVSPGSMDKVIKELTEEYRETGPADVLKQSYRMVYPYGHSQPVLNCAPLRACIVQLQKGEVVMGIVAGDSQRWMIEKTYTGPDGSTPVLAIKPKSDDVTTNLVVTTNRRIYHLTLDSAPSREGSETNPQDEYTRQVSFYYPDALVQEKKQQKRVRMQRKQNVIPTAKGVSLDELNFDYYWNQGADFPWVPSEVFDDGKHVYIKLPPEARSAEAPLLLQVGSGDKRKILNYSIRNNFYITDRVFEKAALVIGVEERSGFLGLGGKERVEKSLKIINRGD